MDRVRAVDPIAKVRLMGMMNVKGRSMENPRRQAVLTAAAMILIAVFVLVVLPPAANDSEKAFRLVIACAALFAGILKWRRAARAGRDEEDKH